MNSNFELTNINGFAGLELGMFKLKDGVLESDMLNAAKAMQKEFLCKEADLFWHLILKSDDNTYLDIALASTKENAIKICNSWMQNEFALQYIDFIEPTSVQMSFWERLL